LAAVRGKAMRPYAVVSVPELPITRSGKIHRRAVRAWLSDVDAGDLSSLQNPECESGIREAGRKMFSEVRSGN